jgi:hypothetical protein
LRKGLNYAVAPTIPPKFEIIKSIETAAVRFAPEKAEDYRAKIKLLLEKCKKFRTNTTTQEEETIKELAKDKSIKILKTDKGNVTVVMVTEDYENKLTAKVNTEKYRKINRDTTKAMEAKVHRNLKPLVEDLGVNIRNLAPKHTKVPHIYGLPKVHKEGYPLRAIVSGLGSPFHSLARFLLNFITPVAGKSIKNIDNSIDFIQQVRVIKIEEGDQIVSFDDVNLFTIVPRKEAMQELQ